MISFFLPRLGQIISTEKPACVESKDSRSILFLGSSLT
jgi:hypothetical protein